MKPYPFKVPGDEAHVAMLGVAARLTTCARLATFAAEEANTTALLECVESALRALRTDLARVTASLDALGVAR